MNVEQKHKIDGPVLALDTSTAAMAAAVVRGSEVLGEVQSLAERNHSVHVVNHVKELLEQCGLKQEELAGIAAGSGPGSYTGMRIAASVAKTMAWVLNKPLVGVSSLEALAYGAWHRGIEASKAEPEGSHWVLPIMDARRGQVYTGCYAMEADGGWSCLAQDGVRLMHNWVDGVSAKLDERERDKPSCIWLVGDLSLHMEEAERLRELATKAGIQAVLFPFVQEGRWLGLLGRQRLEAGLAVNPHTFVPNYTQLTEAEVKLKAKQAGEQTT